MRVIIYLFIAFFLVNHEKGLSQQYEKLIVPFEYNGQFGYMNGAREVIVNAKYDSTFLCKESLCRFKINGKYGFLNMNGEIVIKPKYDMASNFENSVSEVKLGNRKKVINSKGKRARLRGYSMGCGRSLEKREIDSSRVFIQDNGKIGILGYRRKAINSPVMVQVDSFNANFDSLIAVSRTILGVVKNKKIGFFPLNVYGKGSALMIHDSLFKYDEVKFVGNEFEDNSLAMRINDKWGILGYSPFMTIITGAEYKDILIKEGNYYLVEYEDNKFGYVDTKANEYWLKQ